jgi:hypothetical protein
VTIPVLGLEFINAAAKLAISSGASLQEKEIFIIFASLF